MAQLFSGVQFLHYEAGVIHRDIKPCNCLIVFQDHAVVLKICDFGLARLQDCDKTMSLTAVGTGGYMCPQLLDRTMDALGDGKKLVSDSIQKVKALSETCTFFWLPTRDLMLSCISLSCFVYLQPFQVFLYFPLFYLASDFASNSR